MSLVSTLGKVAIGVMVAKGVGKVLSGQMGGQGGGGLGGLLGGLAGGANNKGGAPDMGSLGELLGGGKQQQGGGSGSLGGLLDSLGKNQQSANNNGFGDLFDNALKGEEPAEATASDEQVAALMLRAMISAAKCDNNLDQNEKDKLSKHLGDISKEEAEFVRSELQAPLDIDGLVRDVPRGLEQQVYMMSVLAIDLDSREEAVYLDKLAKGLKISQQMVNNIHSQVGVPALYS